MSPLILNFDSVFEETKSAGKSGNIIIGVKMPLKASIPLFDCGNHRRNRRFSHNRAVDIDEDIFAFNWAFFNAILSDSF